MGEGRVPEGRFADIGALRIHYHEQGQGPPVVFLHGSGPGASGFSNFRRNYPVIADRGLRVIVPDTPGYGYSSKPTDVDYTLDYLAGCLVRFLDALGIGACALVGNSHGGALAIRLALDHPDRVQRLVLMAPGGLSGREAYMQMEGIQAMMQAVLQPGGITRDALRHVLSLQLHDPALLADDIVDERLAVARTQPRRAIASLQVPHLGPELHRLRCPVLGFWGTNDRFCPLGGALTLATSCPRAEVLLLSQCGHWVMVEHAARFNRLSGDFLVEWARTR